MEEGCSWGEGWRRGAAGGEEWRRVAAGGEGWRRGAAGVKEEVRQLVEGGSEAAGVEGGGVRQLG